MDYLNRAQAGLPDAVWQAIEAAAVRAARDRLTARRFLPLEGPFGAGLTAIEVGNDDYCRQPQPDEAGVIIGRAIAIPMVRKSFRLSVRRVAAHLANRQPLDLSSVEDAAEAVAEREEELIYRGQMDFASPGLLTHDGRHRIEGGDWSAVDRALADVLTAVTRLDEAGYRGPYALALAPALFNGLFRLYPGTDVLQLEHLRKLCTRGIYKAPIDGGVVLDDRAGTLILGEDLRAGYGANDGVHYHLFLVESIGLRIDAPGAICTIATTHGADAAPRRDRGSASGD